ncbi:MAG: hypothetical protein AAF490_14345 [Chloroflexota bacterium]
MNLQAITGQLYIVDGYQKDQSMTPGLWVQPPPRSASRGRSSDFLFVHLSLTGAAEETAVLSQDIIDTISGHYYASSGGITSSLREAILIANKKLLAFNVSGSQTPREGAISCAVLRKDELYTVQVGESLAYIGRNFGIETLPPKEPDRITPLGRTSGIDIRFYHHRLQPYDSLLFVDPRLAHLEREFFKPILIDVEMTESLDGLKGLVGHDSARLMLISFTDEVPLQLPDAAQPLTLQKSRFNIRSQPRRESRPVMQIPETERKPQRAHEDDPLLPKGIEQSARRISSRAILGLSRFTDDLADSLDRFKQPEETLDGEEEAEIGWAIPALIAIIIPLIIGGIVTGVFIQRSEGRQLAEYKQEMAINLGLASQTDNRDEQRGHYQEVLALAQVVETELRPGDNDVAAYRREAQQALDNMDNIVRLSATLLYEFTEPVNLSSVVLQPGDGGDLFLLDSLTGVVYQLGLNERFEVDTAVPSAIISPDQAIGSHIVGPVIDIFWRPEGQSVQREGLAALDANGALLSYRPNLLDTVVASLGFAVEWQLPAAITTYDERLYILDQGAEQIWKYFPVGDQFEVIGDERVLAFGEPADLPAVVDFDIYSEDGSLVLLYGDGRIRYYDTRSLRRQWDETEVSQFNADIQPLVGPTAVKFIGQGLGTSIFVADAGSGRILLYNTRAGDVLDQFRATDEMGNELLFQISDFDITPDFQTFFFVINNRVYRAVRQ